jgi:hypothetical protein
MPRKRKDVAVAVPSKFVKVTLRRTKVQTAEVTVSIPATVTDVEAYVRGSLNAMSDVADKEDLWQAKLWSEKDEIAEVKEDESAAHMMLANEEESRAKLRNEGVIPFSKAGAK